MAINSREGVVCAALACLQIILSMRHLKKLIYTSAKNTGMELF